MTNKAMSVESHQDAYLVQASLAGDRDAFAQIVARYQTLVSSLAYCATGSLSRSEDLAQDTFVVAWQRLRDLHEPAKLRAWLCGIAHHLISNAQRTVAHEPAHLAEPFNPANEAVAPEASPVQQAVNREEEAILWPALEQVPDTYRIPLVLYYRMHCSVETVARELDLSDDAVKQRLARGRALLHERVFALVEGSFARSNPGHKFTLGVMTALPVMGTGLTLAAGAATTKSAAGAKTASWLGLLATIITAQVLWFVSSLALVAIPGGFAGWQMSAPGQSAAERRWNSFLWRLLACGLLVFVFPALILKVWGVTHPQYLGALRLWLALFYLAGGVPLVMWAIENHRRIRANTPAVDLTPITRDKSFHRWVAAATLGMAALLVVGLSNSHWYERVQPDAVWNLVSRHPGAEIRIAESEDGGRWIDIVVSGEKQTERYYAPLNEPTYLLLKKNHINYVKHFQGSDDNVLGWPGRRLSLAAILVIGAGAMILGRRLWDRRPTSISDVNNHGALGTV